jgi:hypothetical protein
MRWWIARHEKGCGVRIFAAVIVGAAFVIDRNVTTDVMQAPSGQPTVTVTATAPALVEPPTTLTTTARAVTTTTRVVYRMTEQELRGKLSYNRFESETEKMVFYTQTACEFMRVNPAMRSEWTIAVIKDDVWSSYQIHAANSEAEAMRQYCLSRV